MVHKDTLLKNSQSGSQVERLLWHGTAKDSLDNIYAGGFNRSYCGKNGTYKNRNSISIVLSPVPLRRTWTRRRVTPSCYLVTRLISRLCRIARLVSIFSERSPQYLIQLSRKTMSSRNLPYDARIIIVLADGLNIWYLWPRNFLHGQENKLRESVFYSGLPWELDFNFHTHPIPIENPVGIPTEFPYPQNPEIFHTYTPHPASFR